MSFSDLELARVLSRRLAGMRPAPPAADSGAQPPLDPPDPSLFARLEPGTPPAGGPRGVAVAPAPPGPEAGLPGLLEWFLKETRGEGAFVMDARRVVVACAGALTREEARTLGSRLMVWLDQIGALGEAGAGEAAVVVELPPRTFAAFRAQGAEGTALTVCVSASLPPSGPLREALRRAIALIAPGGAARTRS